MTLSWWFWVFLLYLIVGIIVLAEKTGVDFYNTLGLLGGGLALYIIAWTSMGTFFV
mgnify:CR=1 FL=1